MGDSLAGRRFVRTGCGLAYAVSGEDLGGRQVWAVNVHGLSEDGQAYVPESESLAAALGWRVVTPSLPGFGAMGTSRGGGPVPTPGLGTMVCEPVGEDSAPISGRRAVVGALEAERALDR